MKFESYFDVRVLDHGKLVRRFKIPNRVYAEGLSRGLNTWLKKNPRASAKMGLIDASGFTAVAASDTLASHPGWSEADGYTPDNTGFDPADFRSRWRLDFAAWTTTNQVIGTDQGPPIDFTEFFMTATRSIKGIFITASEKQLTTTAPPSDSSGNYLGATGIFPAVENLVLGNQLQVSYRIVPVRV